jgi:CheY-like chemotaxis protein
MKILVIEDEEPLRAEISEILGLEHFQVIAAENGRIGVQRAREHCPDLILCDVMMPEIDGHGVLTALRQHPATATIPLIFLTARASKTDLRQGMTLGADDYLAKPFTRRELLTAIDTQLHKRAVMQQQMQQQLDDLRGNITLALPHELHTPLAGIISMTELMIADYGSITPAEGLEMLEAIQVSAERLYRLTQNFLLYAELELIANDSTRLAALQHAASSSIADRVIAAVARQTAKQAGRLADLQLSLQPAVAPLAEAKLRKIVEEILDNAFKFSLSGMAVQVFCHAHPFCLTVVDRGRGMTAEQIASIGAYMQFHRKLYEQQGAGLGLIIAKRITELHGGALLIDSTPHQQTTVRVMFDPKID